MKLKSIHPKCPSRQKVKRALPNIHVPILPRDTLFQYQRAWANDPAPFKFGLMARQVGKDFSSGAEGVRDCYAVEKAGGKTTWIIAAPSERQSLEALEKWKEWTKILKFSIADIEEERSDARNSQSLLKSNSIIFPGGSRIMAVPGRPDTVRGYSANVLLTEFAFFDNPDKTWRAILPSITNPLRGGPKKIRLITTPNGVGNKTHELWKKNFNQPDSKWSCHFVNIHDAVRDGLPINVEELHAGIEDPEGWAQEYELNFLDHATVLLPYEIIIPCENPLATETAPPDFWFPTSSSSTSVLFGGIDFARKHDLTVCWTLELVGGAFRMTREVLTLSNMPTPEQLVILSTRVRRMRRACLDYTGNGAGLGDYLVKEFGEYDPDRHLFGKVELCHFTNPLKTDIFPKTRMEFERKLVGIPVSRVIREDLHSIHRVALAGGGVSYRAAHSANGHADRCTALALAIRATATGGAVFAYQSLKRANRNRAASRGQKDSLA
ncbi:MAG: hypothetical protein JWR19_2929 [Pedosphaera sp.]|nr:hypothetical protein [Pedosphaera sp.]